MMSRALSRLEFNAHPDPNRILVSADLASEAPAPSTGTIRVSVQTQIWVGDNPTWTQLQLRVIDTVSRSFALTDELRLQLGSIYERDQKPTAVAQEGQSEDSVRLPA